MVIDRMTRSVPLDTSPEVARLQAERLRAMPVSERAELVIAMCEATTAMAQAGIAAAFPDATEEERAYRLLCRRYGERFADEVRGAFAQR